MKKILIAITVVASGMLASCKKEALLTFDSSSTIYFTLARNTTEGSAIDSTFYSFVYSKDDTMRLPILISAMGKAETFDRPFTMVKEDSVSIAVEGTDYKIGPTVMRAGRLHDTVFITLYRTRELKDKIKYMRFKMLPNEHFQTDIPDRKLSSVARTVPYHKYRVMFNDFASRPPIWIDSYLGPYSIKKTQLMTDLFNFDFANDWQKPPYGPTASINFVLAGAYAMQRYLNEMEADGTPVLEDDGTKMIMGSVVQ